MNNQSNSTKDFFKPLTKLFTSNQNWTTTNDPSAIAAETEEEDGHLVVDMYEKDNSYYIIAPAAGVQPDDIEIELNDEYILIKGKRQQDTLNANKNYVLQECYWGNFSRQIEFPSSVDSEKAAATFKDGMLTICIPKVRSAQTKTLKIKTL